MYTEHMVCGMCVPSGYTIKGKGGHLKALRDKLCAQYNNLHVMKLCSFLATI